MQPANPLQQHIRRAEVGQQQVGIDVQRLLQRLRADYHEAGGLTACAPAQPLFHRIVQQLAVGRRKPPVMQRGDAVDGEQQRRTTGAGQFLQGRLRVDGVGDGVADYQHFGPGASGVQRPAGDGGKVGHLRDGGDGDILILPVFPGGGGVFL